MAKRGLFPGAAVILAVLLAVPGPSLWAQQWLDNGGFEAGTSGWFISQGSPAECTPFEGSGALGITAPAGSFARVFREYSGPFIRETYTLAGWTRVQSGSAQVSVSLAFMRPIGAPGGITVPVAIPSGPQYTPFSVSTTVGFDAEAVRIAFDIESAAGAEVCIDSLSLTTPDPPATDTPAPVDTATSTATSTGVPTDTATNTPISTATPTPVASATGSATPAGTATVKATATNTPTATPTLGPSFTFTNGGFEQGLSGWSKYGGDLRTTTAARSGATAGQLASNTESTKWAYQSVRIDSDRYYEFAAHVHAGENVAATYLRISWYPTADASGPALATADSLQRLVGTSAGYVHLTTGAVLPPQAAASARVRVMLTPASAAAAWLRIDDVSFAVSAPPTATATPSSVPAATSSATPPVPLLGAIATRPTNGLDEEPEQGEPAFAGVDIVSQAQAAAALEGDHTALPDPSAIATAIAEVDSARATTAAGSSAAESTRDEPVIVADEPPGRGILPWLVGAALLVVGVGGTWLQNRRRAA